MHLCIQHKNIIRSKTLKLLMAFSFVTSFQKLFSTKVANKSFAFLNGMRFLAMAWIVFSHTYLASLAAFPLQRNLIYVYGSFSNYFSHLMQQVITSGVLSVSTFLFIGGLLNCYSRVKELEIKKRQSNVFVYIFYRMWRIYPAYIYAIFFVMVLQTLNNGPMFSSISYDYARGCDEKWWRNILFINNLFPVGESCLGHFWYLAVDMQLYLASQITIPVLLKWPRFGIPLNAFIILMSIAFSAFYTWFYNLPPSLVTSYTDKQAIFDYWNVHAHPGMNASQYFIGILVGYLLTTKKQIKIPRVALWIGWPLSFIFGCSAIFGRKKWNGGVMPTDLERILFASLAKPTFTIGVAWVAICCATGHGGIVNYILSRTMWIPLSRLSFLIFLVSYTLQTNFVSSFRNVSDVSHLILVWRFFGDIFISTFVAFVVCMLVEAPFLNLQKLIFSRVKGDLQETESPNNASNDNGHVMKAIVLT
ncbi:nose resistant to fluoxetine protein 6-like [Stegodyphus dumicola]|uniref:nose resistant to fluoxetine protein 6-like n=1 Tax=Stegodyphus dumicola TaxID=202533 RepID=UPI0015AFBFC3|nr:nose resistant to fluoxetine protein 6-like [Stegodyphus dumicola]